ncbi:acetylglutamate kinase [Biomphalaria pfeifferi]|uniref:Isopentenyl phosphate kinase n=1 Tax=Biomphalaria pfeifferi TaxID=112525 RepID=A0AAD8BBN6_BIOPF|nr:acetylglutamate kinase [Biomphalaria pfeifferi]
MGIMCEPHMMTHIDIVIKFGGSAVTDKGCFETYRPDVTSKLAQHVKDCHEAGMSCIIVHGAGSFGHHQAKEYAINEGLRGATKEDHKHKIWGYCLVRQSVLKLNNAVVNSLIDVGVPAISISPGTSWKVKDRQPLHWPHEVLEQYLLSGLVPVFHGDCCMDTDLTCSILSGDAVIKAVCSNFNVKKVVFVTDVAGIYDRPPNFQDAKLLKTLKVDERGELTESIQLSSSANDVTGGMKLKLKSALDIVVQTSGQCPVYITGYSSPNLSDVLLCKGHSEDWNVTRIVKNDVSS